MHSLTDALDGFSGGRGIRGRRRDGDLGPVLPQLAASRHRVAQVGGGVDSRFPGDVPVPGAREGPSRDTITKDAAHTAVSSGPLSTTGGGSVGASGLGGVEDESAVGSGMCKAPGVRTAFWR